MSLIQVKNLSKSFDVGIGFLNQLQFSSNRLRLQKRMVQALNDVNLSIEKSQTLSLVGESGSGKTTLGKIIMGLHHPTSGEIFYADQRIDSLSVRERVPFASKMQVVFQDPFSSLNPRLNIKNAFVRVLKLHFPKLSRAEVDQKIGRIFEDTGCHLDWLGKYPHEFSGGQRQRLVIARALLVEPEFMIADEPIASLDVSIQAQILNLMMDLQEKKKLTYLFIAHDLSVVEHIGHQVAVMYLGHICEIGETKSIFQDPQHPYTQLLLSCIPQMGRPIESIQIKGEIPNPLNMPKGCAFYTRCPLAKAHCKTQKPPLQTKMNRQVACFEV